MTLHAFNRRVLAEDLVPLVSVDTMSPRLRPRALERHRGGREPTPKSSSTAVS